MCERCRERHRKTMVIANEHMDEQGVPENSVMRGLADIELACNAFPILGMMVNICYPSAETLLESPCFSKSDLI